ncbi:2-methylene-furan-3-one reductase-like [Andrographis paniculata]|uniref:2-methylene-furan-3-one reductase-like n=1 Tax=Andrographis paniculata TaxID=175694 RepID=UPI0021E8F914|nr:2-methylene-furan-3-one reductase-like [Andrographis paniculata]XP_051138092.1 2-methylene-furan-3-one reductase-like [Andrographis paniculata]
MQKAWLYEEHGPKEVLKLEDIPIPSPKANQLLIRVHAAALNPFDVKLRWNLVACLDLPVVPGCDMAGVVVAKGGEVLKFDVGDEVYGSIHDFSAQDGLKWLGTLAEFIVVEEDLVATKPRNLSFEEAASLPLAIQTAIEGFRVADFRQGQSVFVVGGAGGVGTLVVQLAKHVYKASKVAATTSTKKVEFVKSLGADYVVDYTKIRYEEVVEKYDLVYDTIGDSRESCVVAKESAPVIDITWPPSNARARHSGLTVSGEILEKIRPCLENGKVKAVIDPKGPFPVWDVIRAFGYLETGRARGKIVISSFPFSWKNSSVGGFCNTVEDGGCPNKK